MTPQTTQPHMEGRKMKVSEFLIKAKSFIEKPENWTQGWYAKNSAGEEISAASPEATCWCSLGALRKAAITEDRYAIKEVKSIAVERLHYVIESLGGNGISNFNDHNDHETVMKVWDRAIKAAQEAEK